MRTRVDRAGLDSHVRDLARQMFFSNATIDAFLEGASASDARAVEALLSEELESRARNKRKRLLNRARFPKIKSFEGYDFSQVSFPEGYGPEDLKSLRFLDSADSDSARPARVHAEALRPGRRELAVARLERAGHGLGAAGQRDRPRLGLERPEAAGLRPQHAQERGLQRRHGGRCGKIHLGSPLPRISTIRR